VLLHCSILWTSASWPDDEAVTCALCLFSKRAGSVPHYKCFVEPVVHYTEILRDMWADCVKNVEASFMSWCVQTS